MKVKDKATEVVTTTKRVVGNAEHFVQAASLLTVAAFSYQQLPHANLPSAVQVLITVALVVIGLRGAYELFRFLDK